MFEPERGRLVSEEFNTLCVQAHVEARVSPYSNPGDPYFSLRKITFQNFNNSLVKIIRQDKNKTVYYIPIKGTLEIVIGRGEPYPFIEKENHA